MNCEQGLKKALYTRAGEKFYILLKQWCGVVPVGERLYWGKVPLGVAMETKKGSEVCVCGNNTGVQKLNKTLKML